MYMCEYMYVCAHVYDSVRRLWVSFLKIKKCTHIYVYVWVYVYVRMYVHMYTAKPGDQKSISLI